MERDKYQNGRRSIRLKGYDYSQAGAYFVTICVQDRRCLLSNIDDNGTVLSQVGKCVYQCMYSLPDRFDSVELDKFVIMPNHIHVIIIINNDNVGAIHELPLRKQRRKMLLPRIAGWLKMNSAKRANAILQKPGRRFWQRNYYEHIIRNENSLNRIREYIVNNPMRWQYDRENPNHVVNKDYDSEWEDIENMIYGKNS